MAPVHCVQDLLAIPGSGKKFYTFLSVACKFPSLNMHYRAFETVEFTLFKLRDNGQSIYCPELTIFSLSGFCFSSDCDNGWDETNCSSTAGYGKKAKLGMCRSISFM